MHIHLLFPKSTFLTDAMVWPPLGLFYLAAQLEAQGHTTSFQDMSLEDGIPEDGSCDQLWISATSSQWHEVERIAHATQGWNKTKTVLGGPIAWVDPKRCRDNLPFDVIVVGEGDHPDVVRRIVIEAQRHTHHLFYAPLASDLSWVLPPIRRWTLAYHSYMQDHLGRQRRMASIFTTRGCPMSCAFCESGREGVIWDSKVRYEPLPVVEAQIRECGELGFDGLAYYDDIFILHRQRTLALLNLHRKYKMAFRCFLRSDILCKHGGREYLEELVAGGLIECFVGVESASNQIKANIHKGTTIEQDEAVLQWCKELGVRCKMSLILGLPGETRGTLEQTRAWILKNRPHIAQVDRLIPFPGTPLVKNLGKYDLIFDRVPEDEWFFRGRFDLNSRSFVSTSALTIEEIDAFWHQLEQELISEGLSSYGH